MIVKRMTEVFGKRVYTDAGDFFGEVEEVNLLDNKVHGWKIRVSPTLSSLFGGARGVVIPHQYVRAISDIFIINKVALPNPEPTFDSSSDDSLMEL